MRVVITGAAGQIGSHLVEELSCDHELCLIDRCFVPGRRSIVGNLARRSGALRWFRRESYRWSDAFAGAQVVVHLAADAALSAPWESILPNNIQATFNVLQAASDHGVQRVVFASSNWAVRAFEQKLAPDCYRMDGPKIDSGTAPFPLKAYGLSKGFGEIAGRMFVDEGRLKSFIAVRIGSFSAKPRMDERLRNLWIGAEDIRTLFRRCVEAEFEGFHIVYGVSAQRTVPYDLTHTRELLSWFPRQLPDDQAVRRKGPV